MEQEQLKQKLETISSLEKKYDILGVAFHAADDVTTEESADFVIDLLNGVGDIREGRTKYTTPNFKLNQNTL